MIRRGLALSLVLGVAAIARADAVVEFGASASANPFNPCGYYDPGEAVTVDVYVTQVGGDEHLLRLVQFNLTGTSGALSIDAVTLDASAGHYLDADLAGGPEGIASAYYYTDPGDLGPNAAQLVMPAGASVRVATLDITLPGAGGAYTLDLLNAGEADPELHGRVSYGFGCDGGSACDNGYHTDATAPVTFLEAGAGLTGGTMTLNVIDQDLTASTPAEPDGLARNTDNCVRLTFANPIGGAGPIALAGQVEIMEMLPAGGLGADLSASFNFEVEADLVTLKIQDGAATLLNEAWYVIRNTGAWATVAPFEVMHAVVYGDANGSGIVDVFDLNVIWLNKGAAPDCSRYDINNSGVVDVFDLNEAWLVKGSARPAMPTGHDCAP